MAAPGDWPVVITDRCADACAAVFGLAGRQQARAWLEGRVARRALVTRQLPAPVAGLRSRSGYFAVVDQVLVLPLAADDRGRAQWIATNCVAIPGAASPRAQVPLGLTGNELLARVSFSRHALERYQQRGDGHPNFDEARRQLRAALGASALASARPPSWCRTRPADFFLTGGQDEEFCLPCVRSGGTRPWEAVTVIHRAGDLLAIRSGPELARYCAFDPAVFPPGSPKTALAREVLGSAVEVTWARPRWARPRPDAKWWIRCGTKLAAPVWWHPADPGTPLLILDITDRRPALTRLLSLLRHHWQHR
jgi:hypothetical protein